MAQTETAEYPHQRHEKKMCFCGKLSPGGTYLSRHTLKNRHILVPDPKSSHALVPDPKSSHVLVPDPKRIDVLVTIALKGGARGRWVLHSRGG